MKIWVLFLNWSQTNFAIFVFILGLKICLPKCQMSPLKVFDIPSRIFDVIEGALIAQSAIVEQLMMMVISKMAMAASFQVNPRKPLWINWLCSFVWPAIEPSFILSFMKIQLSSLSWTILESVKILAKHLLSCYFVHVCPGSNFLDIIVLERMIRAALKK